MLPVLTVSAPGDHHTRLPGAHAATLAFRSARQTPCLHYPDVPLPGDVLSSRPAPWSPG